MIFILFLMNKQIGLFYCLFAFGVISFCMYFVPYGLVGPVLLKYSGAMIDNWGGDIFWYKINIIASILCFALLLGLQIIYIVKNRNNFTLEKPIEQNFKNISFATATLISISVIFLVVMGKSSNSIFITYDEVFKIQFILSLGLIFIPDLVFSKFIAEKY